MNSETASAAPGQRNSRSSLIPRTRLSSPLVDGAEPAVVLIDAPAGFGKSTLLTEWAALDSRPFASVILGEQHDDPVLLTAAIAGALGELVPVSENVYSALHGSEPGTLKVAVPRLLESLRVNQTPIVLALDDVHALADPASLSVVESIAHGLPRGSRLALAARGEPAIRLGRLRANRDLLTLSARDLAMDRTEAEAMLRACGLRLDSGAVDVLLEHTEGWPAALCLAALSLGSSADPNVRAREFAGDDRLVVDYLRDEFVATLTPEAASFFNRTSILDELSGELCDAVLETEGSAATLRDLARSNSLVTPLDARDQRFRYHALLREMLASELHRLDPRSEAALHGRASAWHAARGDYDRAVPHAIASGEADAAAGMIWSQAAGYASAGRQATLELWLERFTTAEIEASAPLCLVEATCALNIGNGAAVQRWTALARAAAADGSEAEAKTIRLAAAAIEAGGSARDGVVLIRKSALEAFDHLGADDPWLALCQLLEGVSYHLGGELGRARPALEDGSRRVGVPSIHALCLAQLALLAVDEGNLAEAVSLSAEATSHSDLNGLGETPTQALVLAAASFVSALNGEAAAASQHAKQAESLLGRLVEMSPWYQAETRIVIARALSRLDDVAAARAHLADAARDLRRIPDAPQLLEWVEKAWSEADFASASERWPLSPAELRLLHFLPTHLSFREIAGELFVSPNTVKTQARSIYQKLGVSSRAEAVECARTAGLLQSADSA